MDKRRTRSNERRRSLSGLLVGYPAGWWVCNRIRISKNCFQTGTGYGSGYPKRFYWYFKDSDFWKKAHIAQSFIHYLQKHLFSLLRHDSECVYGVISVP